MTDVKWPYSTGDEVSHLVMDDVPVLRARIDQLLEERKQLRRKLGFCDVQLPLQWNLTAQEARFFGALVTAPAELATKDHIYEAIACDDATYDAEPKIVDVIACKVRKKLLPFGIEFETVWGRGYRLDPELRARFKA